MMLSMINICADVLLCGRNDRSTQIFPWKCKSLDLRLHPELASIQRGQMRIMDVEQLGKFCWFHRVDLFVQAGM